MKTILGVVPGISRATTARSRAANSLQATSSARETKKELLSTTAILANKTFGPGMQLPILLLLNQVEDPLTPMQV